jgi:dihydrolipoamide dehydrogenase
MGEQSATRQVDLAVIGAGPGGYVAAIRAAQLGMKVIIVERNQMGGVCLNWGCIPTKALLASADVLATVRGAAAFGVAAGEPAMDYAAAVRRSRQVAAQLAKGVLFLMKKNGIEPLAGTARLAGPGKVEVTLQDGGMTIVEAKNVLLATGARPKDFPSMRIDGKRVISSREALVLDRVPASVAVVGGGAIGVEFAHLWQTFGARVTLIEMLPHLLPAGDEEVSQELEKSFRRRKMTVLTGTAIRAIDAAAEGVTLQLTGPDGKESVVAAELALMAVGVQANVEGLGLEACGVAVERGNVKVDHWYRTSASALYAIGDLIGPPCLAHVASVEGIRAVEHMAGRQVEPLDYSAIPACTYCHPQVASVGLSEKDAAAQGRSVRVGRFPLKACGKAVAMGETGGFAKTIVDAESGKILGCHLIGPHVTELVSEMVLARSVGLTASDLLRAVHPHPTLSEVVGESVAAALGEAINV